MSLGSLIREKREALRMTLDDISRKTGYSKPYLSTVETGKTRNPPSDELLNKLEGVLGFASGRLLQIAHMERLPAELRRRFEATQAENDELRSLLHKVVHEGIDTGELSASEQYGKFFAEPHDEDADTTPGEPVAGRLIPVINRVTAGYPVDFDDLDYPAGVAEEYVRCPDLHDPHAFAVRVVGESMEPRYHEGDIVIFSPGRQVDNGDDAFVRLREPHETTFKQVFFDAADTVRLQPRNARYSPLILAADRINGIWKAVVRYERL